MHGRNLNGLLTPDAGQSASAGGAQRRAVTVESQRFTKANRLAIAIASAAAVCGHTRLYTEDQCRWIATGDNDYAGLYRAAVVCLPSDHGFQKLTHRLPPENKDQEYKEC